MKYKAEINVMPLKELLDPQGKAVLGGLKNLAFTGIENVRIGKHITLDIDAATEAEAKTNAELACKKLLANAVMEHFEISIVAAN
ncbi:MAG: phosphoribosylformylglycinamidine synthase subunit PurS [Bacteroidota bacterium]|jgi:phosphoribosylformylglycinamidine synthase